MHKWWWWLKRSSKETNWPNRVPYCVSEFRVIYYITRITRNTIVLVLKKVLFFENDYLGTCPNLG